MAITNGFGASPFGAGNRPYANLTAGQKAAATRRANRAAGIPPKTSRRNGTTKGASRAVLNTYTAQPSSNALQVVALAAFEAAVKAKLGDDRKRGTLAADAPQAFDRYQKLKALALGPTVNDASRVEAQSALRMSMIAAIKLIF